MQDIVRTRLLLFLTGIIIVPLGTVLVILFAKGYRPDLQKRGILVTGLLVAHSYPEGAQVFVNDQLKSATNTTINLTPGNYSLEIKKEGYQPWKKDLIIQPEIVTRATAVLFPSVPTLKPITAQGAANPLLSPDGTKVIFTSPSGSQLFLLDLNESPLGLLNRDSKLIADFKNIKINTLYWSPDSRQVLSTTATSQSAATPSAYLIDIFSQQPSRITSSINLIINEWNQNRTTHELQKFSTLPAALKDLFATASADLEWSPREDKLLYTATASAAIPDDIIKPLLGSSTQPQERQLIPGHIYVYDLEEDRNFLIDAVPVPVPGSKPSKTNQSTGSPISDAGSSEPNQGWNWFPTSSHLYKVEDGKIIIVEYDGQNSTTVYSGPMEDKTAIPYPSAKQVLILANLNSTPQAGSASASANLYALILR
jgi:hypothetical protein